MKVARYGDERGRGFRDRREAGRALAEQLLSLKLSMPVVVALPRGGVPVGYEVGRAMGAPLDVGLVRKLGAPGQPEYAIGAIAEEGVVVLDDEAIAALGISGGQVAAIINREQAEMERRRDLYRGHHSPVNVRGRTVLLIDDGIATGLTAAAAARALRARGASQVFVAVPVCPAGSGQRFAEDFDGLICLVTPPAFGSVGAWYEDFSQTSDDEVIELLRSSRRNPGDQAPVEDVEVESSAPEASMGRIAISRSDSLRIRAEFRFPGSC